MSERAREFLAKASAKRSSCFVCRNSAVRSAVVETLEEGFLDVPHVCLFVQEVTGTLIKRRTMNDHLLGCELELYREARAKGWEPK